MRVSAKYSGPAHSQGQVPGRGCNGTRVFPAPLPNPGPHSTYLTQGQAPRKASGDTVHGTPLWAASLLSSSKQGPLVYPHLPHGSPTQVLPILQPSPCPCHAVAPSPAPHGGLWRAALLTLITPPHLQTARSFLMCEPPRPRCLVPADTAREPPRGACERVGGSQEAPLTQGMRAEENQEGNQATRGFPCVCSSCPW